MPALNNNHIMDQTSGVAMDMRFLSLYSSTQGVEQMVQNYLHCPVSKSSKGCVCLWDNEVRLIRNDLMYVTPPRMSLAANNIRMAITQVTGARGRP